MRVFRIRMHIGFDRESQCSPRFVMLTDLNQYLNSDKNLNSKNEPPIKIMQNLHDFFINQSYPRNNP
jgi:hypothetical protein